MGGQAKLKAASVLVVGAGGLGCPVLQYLAAAGVGTLGVADGDVVDISNLQRQVLYTTNDIGKSKAEVAAQKIKSLNSDISITIIPEYLDSNNALDIVNGYDIVVDGSDNFDTRYLVNDACVISGKVMVSGAIYKYEGQVSVFNYNGGPTYRCLFPEQPGVGESPNCADIGVIATLPGIIGTIQANEVIKIVTDIGSVLSGRLLVLDTLSMETSYFSFKLNPENLLIEKLPEVRPVACNIDTEMITYSDLRELVSTDKQVQLVDVRELEEHNNYNIGGNNIPMSELDCRYDELDKNTLVVLYCASGVRSGKSAELLRAKGFVQVLQLKGGVNATSL